MVLQLGLAFVGCVTNVRGIQIWAEYAQSLPVSGITATDAYQLKINGVGSPWVTGAHLNLLVPQQPLKQSPMRRRGYNWPF